MAAFRGTEIKDPGDLITDAGQNYGAPTSQYRAAPDLGRLLANNPVTRGKISSTGHSLGGGLSAGSSLAGGFHAVNFNAAGINPLTASRLGLNLAGADTLVQNYNTPGDFLSQYWNSFGLGPRGNGRQMVLPSPGSLPLMLNRHLTHNLIPALHQALIDNGCDIE